MTARKESPMDRDNFDQCWWPLAQEVLTGMKEWRLQHPTATFSEIEAALDARLGRLRARMLCGGGPRGGAGGAGAPARRQTEAAGAILAAWQEQEVARLERECPPAPAGPAKQFFSADGAFVPLLHGEWAEVKTLALGEIGEPVYQEKEGEWVAPTRALSYFSRLADADTFGRLALVETQRRGTESAGAVAAVTGGAEWVQGLIDLHRPDAVRILDFPHAAQRLAPIAQAVWGAQSEAATRWVAEQTKRLKEHGPADLLTAITALLEAHPEAEGLAEHVGYLQKRAAQMQYPAYRAQGLPIGSGPVESANKLVVEARLKGAGMHWERAHVDPMLALRNAVCNDRWAEAWKQIARGLREQAGQRQMARRGQRAQAAAAAAVVAPAAPAAPAGEEKPAAAGKQGPAAGAAGRRPAADRPWRRFHIGRATDPPRAVMLRAKQ